MIKRRAREHVGHERRNRRERIEKHEARGM